MSESVSEIMARMDRFDWLATVTDDDNGDWRMLYAPAVDPSDESIEEFNDELDKIMQAPDLDHVTEIGNGWFVFTNDD